MSDLQKKLKQMKGLLPSQQQWLERLVFQLEFNPYQLIHLVGGPGTGKSTLTLAIADLLSGEFNLALLKAEPELTTVRVRQHLVESWFGFCKDASRTMLQLVGERQSEQPLALVLDQAEQLPLELWAELAELPCLVVAATLQPDPHAELNLPVPGLTLEDATLLLQDQQLSTLSVADRLDIANGNMHILLQPALAKVKTPATVVTGKGSLVPPLLVFSTGMLLIAAVVGFWFWSEQQLQSAGLGELTYLPAEQEINAEPQPATPVVHASKAVVEQLVDQLEEVKTPAGSSKVAGMARNVDFSTAAETADSAVMQTHSAASEAVETKPTAAANPQSLPDRTVAAANAADQQATVTETLTPEPAVAVEATESSLEQQMAAELALPQQQVVPETVAAEPEEDLAAQAAAELSTEIATQTTPVAPAVAESRSQTVPSGGYLFSESELLSMSGQQVALQLVVFSNDVAQQNFIRNNPQLKTHTYQRSKNGQRQLVVVLAPFADAAAAKAKISTLPAPLQQAFVKSLADIHSEISTQ
jgi:septal ring-binding cell division protein DamX